MSDATFRLASPDDADNLLVLIERAYRGEESAGRWDSESHILKGPRTSHAEIAGYLSDPDSRFVLAERDDQIIGCALIQKSANSGCANENTAGKGAYFGMFAIDPSIRSAGLGKSLLAECETRARDLWQATAMVMTVISIREELIAWYQRRGYAPTGDRVPFPFSETSGEVRNDFDLVELRKAF